ncbi:UNVERIFIED_CONTAM: hypothetical protein Sradi_2330700 [Sesamum radiatum]|uniref:Secreted protein n=1 Tax=Sesamum radiatum TaxID=300843 RepID=A0AAW2T624_SESRA
MEDAVGFAAWFALFFENSCWKSSLAQYACSWAQISLASHSDLTRLDQGWSKSSGCTLWPTCGRTGT